MISGGARWKSCSGGYLGAFHRRNNHIHVPGRFGWIFRGDDALYAHQYFVEDGRDSWVDRWRCVPMDVGHAQPSWEPRFWGDFMATGPKPDLA